MPGIAYITNIHSNLDIVHDAHTLSQSLYIGDGYTSRVLYKSETTSVVFAGYDGYPLQTIEDAAFLCFLEGKIYGRSGRENEQDVIALARSAFQLPDVRFEGIEAWIGRTDGEFVLAMIEKSTGNTIILNDFLGRLSLYMHTNGERLIVSRDIVFFRHFDLLKDFDSMAVAYTLLFGYPLDEKTIYRAIRRVPPGTVIVAGRTTKKITVSKGIYHNFDCEEHLGDVRTTAARLADLFIDGTTTRSAGNDLNLLSLSGGLDSRAVAASLSTVSTPTRALSFLVHSRNMMRDVRIAKDISSALNIPWELVDIPLVSGSDAQTLLEQKCGLICLSVSYYIPLFKYIRAAYGGIKSVFHTGDGGDKVLVDLRPINKIASIDTLADYIVSKQSITPITSVSALTGIPVSTIKDDIPQRVSVFPEQDLQKKFVHFIIYERAFKWLFEGEDRNRFALWSTTPFYSLAFFDAAMKTPWKHKHQYALYRTFLSALSPDITRIVNESWDLPVDSRKLTALLYAKDMVYRFISPGKQRFIRGIIKKRRTKATPPLKNIDHIQRQLNACKESRDVFPVDISALCQLITAQESADYLLTLTSLMEYIFKGATVFNENPQQEFF